MQLGWSLQHCAECLTDTGGPGDVHSARRDGVSALQWTICHVRTGALSPVFTVSPQYPEEYKKMVRRAENICRSCSVHQCWYHISECFNS